MTDVAQDGLVFHAFHVLVADDMVVAGRGHEDVGLFDHVRVVEIHHPVAFHRGLQCADGINFRDPYGRSQPFERLGAALANIAVAADDCDLARDHHIGRTLDAIHQRFAAAVQIIELGFGDRIVYVDRRERQQAVFRHLVETVYARGGFLGHAAHRRQTPGVPVRVLAQMILDGGEQGRFFLVVRVGDE